MKIVKTTFDKIKKLRANYLNSLPEFQELFLEIMVKDSDFYLLHMGEETVGYAIKNSDSVLLEFYVADKYISSSNDFFQQVLKELSITEIYCKSFDALLLSCCLQSSFLYKIIGVLYRDYVAPLVAKDAEITMQKSALSSVKFLLNQDDSIKELFETEAQLNEFIRHENVFEFYKNNEFIGCGMALRTNPDWIFCDLGVWVNPLKRGSGMGAQIILNLRNFALKNDLKQSCGCAVENIASQKTIEKSGFVSRHKLIEFTIK
ncbi:MAG: GNAT family N-acetyltransferase [Prevotellaceae bacterium]|jgi:RimJ/RimL family protein N-acetyltransferase|nr:GNAT family N-acetyltransferase [Prevotellaceae bacterium]